MSRWKVDGWRERKDVIKLSRFSYLRGTVRASQLPSLLNTKPPCYKSFYIEYQHSKIWNLWLVIDHFGWIGRGVLLELSTFLCWNWQFLGSMINRSSPESQDFLGQKGNREGELALWMSMPNFSCALQITMMGSFYYAVHLDEQNSSIKGCTWRRRRRRHSRNQWHSYVTHGGIFSVYCCQTHEQWRRLRPLH